MTAYVFSMARAHSFFSTAAAVPAEIVKACQAMTAHLEVSRRSAQDWEYAILAGYRVFEELTANKGGTVHLDLPARTITYSRPRSGDPEGE